MKTYFYLSIFPNPALIASQLTPQQFGSYMAIGNKYGSYERIIFIEVEGNFGTNIDWDYAKKRCRSHEDGSPKNSVWLSVYRALEYTPIKAMKSMYLVTQDGRSLEIQQEAYKHPPKVEDYYVYSELCPIHPLVISRLPPPAFGEYMTNPNTKVSVPKLAFADLKTIDLDNPEATGNIGPTYDHNLKHFADCLKSILDNKEKQNKNIERDHSQSFSYNIINRGIYIADSDDIVCYPLPSTEKLRQMHYDWTRSAMII